MAQKFFDGMDKTQEFLDIVEAHGGKECKHWTKVARVFYETTGVQVDQSYKLRKRWETLTRFKEELNLEQKRLLYETGIRSRGNSKGGLQEFTQSTGIKMYVGRYTKVVSNWFKAVIKMFQEMFGHDKKTRYKRLDEDKYRLSYVSIYSMLRAVDIKDCKGDYVFEELKIYAKKLEYALYQCAGITNIDDLIDRFQVYNFLNRKTFKRLMFYLDYVNELKQISINYYKGEIFIRAHPLLQKTIQQNKESLIYESIIVESDWKKKYSLYQEISAVSENDNYSMLIKKAGKGKQNPQLQNDQMDKILENYEIVSKTAYKVCNRVAHAQITQSDKQQLRTFRGHYVRPGQIKSKGWTTIVFEHDDYSSDGNQEIDVDENEIVKNAEIAKQYNEIFQQTFAKDDERQKKRKKKLNQSNFKRKDQTEKPYSF